MTESAIAEGTGTKQLVLGFDAGCSTCTDLAKLVEERVDGKLGVRNLRDPEVQRWRERALGVAAPWAPALFEVEGEKVRAWAGWRMGWALSRTIGPTATWRVMQALGEVGAAPKLKEAALSDIMLPERAAEVVTGISRGQFLKGVGGAALAMSVLSSSALFPSVATAATPPASTGTLAQRTLVKSIVRASPQFKALSLKQAQIGASIDFRRAIINVNGVAASLVVPSASTTRSVIATFFVNLVRRTVTSYRSVAIAPAGYRRATIKRIDNGRATRLYPSTLVAERYVVTSDGRRMDHQKFLEELRNYNSQRRAAASQTTCQQGTALLCGAVDGGACYFGCPLLGLTTGVGGLGCAVGCALIATYDCDHAVAQNCGSEPVFPPLPGDPPPNFQAC